MKKIRLLIVDDEALAHTVLEGYCSKIDYVEVVGNCLDGISTINFLNENEVDALLLDIQMPDFTGIELLDSLKNQSPKVIFTTAYTEYAFQSFNYDQVVDYLHKPIRLTRFVKAMERLKKQLQLEQETPLQESSPSAPTIQTSQKLTYLYLKDNKIIYKIAYEDIAYFQSWGNYLKVFLDNGDMKIYRKTIKQMVQELPQSDFMRIHKSYIVNLHKLKAVDGNQIMLQDLYLPIGRAYQMQVKQRIMDDQ